jgi:hypothetical protein
MSTATAANQQPPSAIETDPQTLGWMQGLSAASRQNYHLSGRFVS